MIVLRLEKKKKYELSPIRLNFKIESTTKTYINTTKSIVHTLEFAISYISPSTFRAYATKLCIRLSNMACGSGVGNIACTL
jgi:hypothetical protein